MRVLLEDLDLLQTRPLSRLRTIFSNRDGIYNSIERVKLHYNNSDIFFYHPNSKYEKLVSEIDELESFSLYQKKGKLTKNDFDLIINSEVTEPLSILSKIKKNIEDDIKYFKTECFRGDIDVIGSKKDIFVSNSAIINKGVILDSSEGSIVIDDFTVINPHSYLKGPLYIGKKCCIDNARIYGGNVIGHNCRIGGEVENTIFNDFSNKHHDGFVGHSIVGRWVNFGALSTTSDLKNNYGIIKVTLPLDFCPSYELKTISTNTIKFGSIIGDCTKIAIGKMLNTGSVIDCGCNLFKSDISKYMPPLCWGSVDEKYDTIRFINDCKIIFARRGKVPNNNYIDLINMITTAPNKGLIKCR